MFSLKVSSILLLMMMMMMMVMVSFVNSDTSKDRDECATQLVGLAVCLPYVGGTAKAPTPDCCSGLKGVIEKSKKCLCILVKDRNDPALGLKINATLALSLPATCHVPSNASECPALLHLAPNSPEAQVFEEFAKNSKAAAAPASSGNTPSSSDTKSSTQEKSGASRGKRWFDTVKTIRQNKALAVNFEACHMREQLKQFITAPPLYADTPIYIKRLEIFPAES